MFAPIPTERLLLRTLEESDAGVVHAYRADPENSRFQDWPFSSVDEVRAFLARQHGTEPFSIDDWFQIGITLRATGEVVGDCGLHARDHDRRQFELGITLARPAQRHGFGLEAMRAMLEFLFRRPDTHRVFCSVDPRNRACVNLLEKAGMRREAHLLESLWFKGEWVDDVIFAMLQRDRSEPRPMKREIP